MVDKIIPPRRDEVLTEGGRGSIRTMEYLERTATQVNNSTELTETDPSSINLSGAQLSQINKKISAIVNESLTSQNALITKLNKKIERLESAILSGQNTKSNKKIKHVEDDLLPTMYKEYYRKLNIKVSTVSDLTIGSRLRLPSENNFISPTVQFGDGDSGFYEESDDVIGVSLNATKRYSFSDTTFTNPNGYWNGTGLNINSGDIYKIGNQNVLSVNTLGGGVVNSSLTSVGTLTTLNTSGVYSVNGTQVLEGQGAAIPGASGTLASATTTINTILFRLRAHGLIAT